MGLHVKVGLCVLTFIKLWLRAEIQSFHFMHSAYLNASHWIYLNRYDIGNFAVFHTEIFFLKRDKAKENRNKIYFN